MATLDLSIYDKMRLWRVPNTINGKSGLYKIPLTVEELLQSDLTAIKALATWSRQIDIPSDDTWEANGELQKLWIETSEPSVLRPAERSLPGHEQKILPGSRNSMLTSLAGTMRRRGMGETAIVAALLETNATTCEPSLKEDEVRGIAASVARYAPGVKEDHDDVDRARQVVLGLSERANDNKFAPFEPEALKALALVRNHDAAAFMRTREQLKRQGIPVAELDRSLKEHNKKKQRGHLRVVQPGEVATLPTAGQLLPDAPAPDLVIPEPYCVRSAATVRVIHGEGNGPQEHTIAFAPILITGRLRNEEENVESLRLTYRRDDRWHDQTVDRGIALDGRRLVELASAGFPVAGDNAKEVAKYLQVMS